MDFYTLNYIFNKYLCNFTVLIKLQTLGNIFISEDSAT